MLRFTLRDVFWFTLLAALVLIWWREGINLDSEKRNLDAAVRQAESQRDSALRRLRSDEPYYVANGWHTQGDPDDYEIRLDHEACHGGQSCALIKVTSSSPDFPATLTQVIRAEDYRDRRVELSAYMKAEDADSCLFVYFSNSDQPPAPYPDVRYAVLRGNADWTRGSLVVDVPHDAVRMSFGLVTRSGSAWLDDVQLEVADPHAPPTRPFVALLPVPPRMPKNFPLPNKPLNLDFED
jgi:hypothetical protein